MVSIHTVPARLETNIVKTKLTEQSLADLMVVLRTIPQEEIEQLNAFSGEEFDADQLALQLATTDGPKYTIRVAETGEPLVVAGLVRVGTSVWRTWFFANPRAWEEYGREVTVHTARTRKNMLSGVDFARIETVALANRQRKVFEWYEACGMTYESTMHGYGVNGESAVMYVSTKGARNY